VTRAARRWVVAAVVALAVAAVAGFAVRQYMAREGGPLIAQELPPVDPAARPPEGVRIRVQVLNASGVRGQARRATMELRDRGFDVVEIGNASERRDSTLVLSRAGEADWAERVARALGGVPVEVRPDSSHYLEVSVLLGGDWSPPPGPFRP